MPGLHEARDPPRPGRAGLQDFPGLEWDGDDVHGRAYTVARSKPSDKLVQFAALALPGHFVGVPVCGVDASDPLTTADRGGYS